MTKENINERVSDLVRWASNLANRHNVSTLTILAQFKRLKDAGADVEQAKKEIKEVYEG